MIVENLYEHRLNYNNGNYSLNKRVTCNLIKKIDKNNIIIPGETTFDDYISLQRNDWINHISIEKIVDECNELCNLGKKAGYKFAFDLGYMGRKIVWISGNDKLENKTIMRLTLNRGRKDHSYIDIPFVSSIEKNIENIENSFEELIQVEEKIDLECDFSNVDIILSPKAAGYFIHEIIGHPLEKDIVEKKQSFYSEKDINLRILPDFFNIVEAPNELCEFGYDYGGLDDEENALQSSNIIERGVLKSFIQYKRCSQFRYPCVNRMHNLVLRPNEKGRDLNSIVETSELAIVIDEIIYGNFNIFDNRFNLFCGKYRYVKDGKVIGYDDGVIISDEISAIKDKVVEIGSDFKRMIGLCTKQAQTLNVGMGAPTMLLKNIKVQKGND